MSFFITIGQNRIQLADDVDITELKSEVVRNVHAGGGWLALPINQDMIAGDSVEVFVSVGQYIGIEAD